jgi:hypothetical protein
MKILVDIVLVLISLVLIGIAVNIGRPKKYWVKLYTKNWFIQFVLIIIACLILILNKFEL